MLLENEDIKEPRKIRQTGAVEEFSGELAEHHVIILLEFLLISIYQLL